MHRFLGSPRGKHCNSLKRERLSLFFFFLNPNPFTICHVERWKTHLDGKILISLNFVSSKYLNFFSPRQFWRDLLLLDLSKGFLSELAQRCIERFVIFKRLGFHRKRVIIELCLDCVKQTTCCCSHKGWQQNSNRPHSQWYVGHLSHITPYPYYLSCAPCILLEQDNTTTSSR